MEKEYMKLAVEMAKLTKKYDDVPVGAVIVKDGVIISKTYNTKEKDKKIHAHAEINAINEAIDKTGDWRLNKCDMYVTLEPCPMCAGAIQQARIRNVYIGCRSNLKENTKIIKNIFDYENSYHKVNVIYMEDKESSKILTEFFTNKRK